MEFVSFMEAMMLRIAMLASAAVLSTATMLNADTEQTYQTVVITDFGFFPLITYVDAGEVVQFNNQADAIRVISAIPFEDSEIVQWTSPELEKGETFLIQVNEDTVLEFTSSLEEEEQHGSFSFDEPPIEEAPDTTMSSGNN
jgi:plastocyanin